MESKKFVHLHLHTDYSLLDGAIQIKPLSERLEKLGMNACAMTDHGNMYGAISFYNTMNERGINPIIGCETYIAAGNRKDRGGRGAPALTINPPGANRRTPPPPEKVRDRTGVGHGQGPRRGARTRPAPDAREPRTWA